jgi:hypothetical protein
MTLLEQLRKCEEELRMRRVQVVTLERELHGHSAARAHMENALSDQCARSASLERDMEKIRGAVRLLLALAE